MFTKEEILNWIALDGLVEIQHTWAREITFTHSSSDYIVDFWADIADVEDDGKRYRINGATIRKGIRVGYEKRDELGDPYQRQAFSDLHRGKWDDVDYDAFTADYLIQFALFGEVRYS